MAGTRGPAPQPHALQVDVHHLGPGLGRGVEDAAVVVGEDAGVVEQHVETAVGVDTAAATMAATCASSETSTVTAVAVPPAAMISATADVGAVGDHVGHHHPGPLGGEQEAATRPMPLPAPVITATLPSSRAMPCLRAVA